MVLPGVSAKRYQGTLEDDSWDSGVGDTKNLRPTTEKGILASHEGVQAASEVIGTEAQLLLAP